MLVCMSGPVKSSNRTFGLFFAIVFAILSFLSINDNHLKIALVTSTSAVALLVTATFLPEKLRILNESWTKLSSVISKITSPIIMGFIFMIIFLPVSLVGKLRGRDLLLLKAKPGDSCWVDVSLEYSENFSFRNQY